MPSGPSWMGAGVSKVMWSMSFDELEVRVQRLVPADVLAGVGGHAAHQGGDFRLAGPPGFVVRLVLPDRVNSTCHSAWYGLQSRCP